MATRRLCSIPECGKPHDSHGYCKTHAARARRGLNLHAPLRKFTPKGKPMDFIHVTAMAYEGDECLPWPYAKGTGGYGLLHTPQGPMVASRYLCKVAHGEPPHPSYEAAHSCGNGHLACMNKKHLSWKSTALNAADKIAAGTVVRGTDTHFAMLDEDKVLVIRSMKGKLSISRLARMFGVGETTVQQAQSGKRWGWLSV